MKQLLKFDFKSWILCVLGGLIGTSIYSFLESRFEPYTYSKILTEAYLGALSVLFISVPILILLIWVSLIIYQITKVPLRFRVALTIIAVITWFFSFFIPYGFEFLSTIFSIIHLSFSAHFIGLLFGIWFFKLDLNTPNSNIEYTDIILDVDI